MSTTPRSIAILGAGVTGLVAAHRLHQLGHRVRVFEQSSRAGGVVRTEETEGWLIEAGPNSLLTGEPALESLIQELGLSGEVVPANPAARNRYIVHRGRLVAAPLSPGALVRSCLFSITGKVGIVSELLTRPRVRSTDISLAEFIRGHFGQEFVERALNPMVSGVYAGNPTRLSARYAFPKLWEMEQRKGSLLRAQIAQAKERRTRGEAAPSTISFRHGLETLIQALVNRLPDGCIAFNASLDAITPGDKKWNVIWNQADTTHTQSFDAIVIALPAHALARLRIGSLGERPLAALDGVEHPPLSSLFLGFKRDQIAHPLDGFGVLVPSGEKRSILGTLFSSTLFPHRSPDGHVALTVLIGGTRQPELASLPLARLLSVAMKDLSDLLGIVGDPQFVRHTLWPKAIPQYNLGHEQYLASIAQLERVQKGLFVGGQARDGISLPACVTAGEKLARRCIL